MTNLELKEAGELYDANYDPQLNALMDHCKDLCQEYNGLKPSDWAGKDAKLREIGCKVGGVPARVIKEIP